MSNGKDAEWIRTLMASAFTGAAGAAMPWDYQWDRGDPTTFGSQLSVYQSYLGMFMEGIDLDGENWRAFRSERADKRAEMLYLVRGDGTQATGFIGNRTYNFYTAAQENNLVESGCYDFDAEGVWATEPYRFLEPVASDLSGDQIQWVFGLNDNATYQTAFYDAFYPVNQPSVPLAGPVATPTNGVGFLKMPHPDLEIPDYPDYHTPFLLFRTEQTGNPFRVAGNSSTGMAALRSQAFSNSSTNEGEMAQSVNIEEIGVAPFFSVYPNPVRGKTFLNIVINGSDNRVGFDYELVDATGKILKAGRFIGTEARLDIHGIVSGVYNLRISTDEIVENHTIIVM